MGDTAGDLADRLERDGSVSIDHERLGPWMTAICGIGLGMIFWTGTVLGPFVGEWTILLISVPLGVLTSRMAVRAVRVLAKPRGAVVVDADGITVPSQQMVLPWQEIFGAQRQAFRGREILCVSVSRSMFERHSPWYVKLIRRIPLARREDRRGTELIVLPGDLRISGRAFAAWITEEAQKR